MPPKARKSRSTAVIGVDVEIINRVNLLGLRPQMHQVFDQVKREVADAGEVMVHQFTGGRIKDGTGDYMGQITTKDVNGVFRDRAVTDRGHVAGPWLEAGSSRTGRTRFKGYRGYRQARTRMRVVAKQLMSRRMDAFVQRINR